MPMRSSCSRMYGTAAAASGVLTVMRTNPEPATASSLTWIAVPTASTVSVLVIAWTRTGASPPIVTTRAPQRTTAWRERRGAGCAGTMNVSAAVAISLRITSWRSWLLQLDAGAVVRGDDELGRLTAKAEMCRRGVADTDAKRRLAVEADRFARLHLPREQGAAPPVGDFDPRRRRR